MTYFPEDSTVSFMLDPIYKGSWCIGGNWHVFVTKRPTNEQIKNTEELLGWEWNEEGEKTK
jgi:hypothetical protein